MDKLTDDVLQTILDWVEDRATLHTLLSVSRCFYACTEPRLYSSVEFIAKPQTALRPRFHKFQRRIASNSYLASKVKKFTIDLADSNNPPEDFSLHDTLRYLVGLKDLRLKICINSDISITALTKVHCPFFLTKFVWQNPRAGLQALVPFLESQPFIEHLHLVLTTTTINLSPEALPRLKELVVPSSMAMNILPGRKVTHLSLMLVSDNSSFDHAPSLAMEEALAHIEFLGCFASKAEYLLPGIRLMHKLRWLQIMFPAQSNADMLDLLRVVRDRATNLTYMQLPAFFMGSLKGLTTQILESVPPACLVDIGRQGNVVFDRYCAGKHISSVSEDVAPTEREWWWSEAKLRHVLTGSMSLSPTSSPKHTRVTESSLKVHKRP